MQKYKRDGRWLTANQIRELNKKIAEKPVAEKPVVEKQERLITKDDLRENQEFSELDIKEGDVASLPAGSFTVDEKMKFIRSVYFEKTGKRVPPKYTNNLEKIVENFKTIKNETSV